MLVGGTIVIPSGDSNYIPPIFVTVASGQSLSLTKVRSILHSGGTVTFTIYQNGTALTDCTGLVAGTTVTSNTVSDALADGDILAVVVTAVSGTPVNMTIQLVMN